MFLSPRFPKNTKVIVIVSKQMESRSFTDRDLRGRKEPAEELKGAQIPSVSQDEAPVRNRSLYFTPKASPQSGMKVNFIRTHHDGETPQADLLSDSPFFYPQDPVKDSLQDPIPDLKTPPTGI